MDYARQQRNPSRHLVGIGGVRAVSRPARLRPRQRLARRVRRGSSRVPIEVKVIEEIAKPPPPPPEVVRRRRNWPPPTAAFFIPPPEINIAPPPDPGADDHAVTRDTPPTTALPSRSSRRRQRPAPPPPRLGRRARASFAPQLRGR